MNMCQNPDADPCPPEPKVGGSKSLWYAVSKAGSLFAAAGVYDWTVIEVPGGWKANGDALMGYGDAKTLADIAPSAPLKIGAWLKALDKGTASGVLVVPKYSLFIMRTKPVRVHDSQPYLSWKNPDDPALITAGLKSIREVVDRDLMPISTTARLVLRPPGTTSSHGPITLRASMKLVESHLRGLRLTIVSSKL